MDRPQDRQYIARSDTFTIQDRLLRCRAVLLKSSEGTYSLRLDSLNAMTFARGYDTSIEIDIPPQDIINSTSIRHIAYTDVFGYRHSISLKISGLDTERPLIQLAQEEN
jgi:hypothetical protein